MSYINEDIEPTLQKLRSHYHNDGTFKGYVNILVIITSHFKRFEQNISNFNKNQYQN